MIYAQDVIELIFSVELGVDVKISEFMENGVIENILKGVMTKVGAKP